MNQRKIRFGMVGGGSGAFIGKVHHMAAVMDNEMELVCGAFSSDPQKSRQSALAYYLPEEKGYANYEEMVYQEAQLPEGERMDMVVIVTPNNMHFEPARLALENGFHVICDKPVTFSLQQARELESLVKKTGLLFGVTYTYTGYPMVKEARKICSSGEIGKIRKVLVEYIQGWLTEPIELSGHKQASWRTDPQKAGLSCTMGDIGVHAINLAEYITTDQIDSLYADTNSFVPGRQLDDDDSALLTFQSGAKGVLSASQICTGEENGLKIQVYGEKGGIEWHQMEPNSLIVKWNEGVKEIKRTALGALSESSLVHTRVPAGHPEGYIEAFANIYRNFAYAIRNHNKGKAPELLYDFPGIKEGLRGMLFIDKLFNEPEKKGWISLAE